MAMIKFGKSANEDFQKGGFNEMDLISENPASNDEVETSLMQEKIEENENVVDIISEDESLRDENVKHFHKSDGSYKAVVYGEEVHYE